jgi:uncharacterized protein (DUF2461 family)
LKDWETYVATIQDKIISVDETIPELPFKDVNFRIYRDVRFSKNPDPYKVAIPRPSHDSQPSLTCPQTHYGVAFSRTGRKGPYACYYIHCEPGHAFIGGGLWHPEADAVAKLRASIDERPERWRRVLMDPVFRRTFMPEVAPGKAKAAGKKEEAAVKKAFAGHNQDNALKTKPKVSVVPDQSCPATSFQAWSGFPIVLTLAVQGFHAEHRDIELLKLRNFTIGKRVPDEIFTDEDGQDQIVECFRAMVPFVSCLPWLENGSHR